MKLQIPSANLLSALKSTIVLAKEKQSNPILSNFLFVIKENSLNIITTNSTGVRMSVAVDGVETGSNENINIAVPQKIKEIMETLTDESVVLNFEDYELEVVSSSGSASMQTFDANAYPDVDMNITSGEFTEMDFPTNNLLKGIDLVQFACSNSPLRPIMQGVHIEVEDNTASFVATDAHCLARFKAEMVMCPDCEINIMQSHANLLKLILQNGIDTKITLTKSQIKFAQNNNFLLCPTIEGVYPAFKRIIPAEINNQTSVKKGDLTRALSRVRVCTNSATLLVKIGFYGENMAISGEDVSYGTKAIDNVKCDAVGKPLEIGMNVETLLKSLQPIPSDIVNIAYEESNRPLAISPKSEEDLIILLMPVTLS